MDCPLPPAPGHTTTQRQSISPLSFSGLEGAQPSVPPGSVSVCRAGVGLGPAWVLEGWAHHRLVGPPPPLAPLHEQGPALCLPRLPTSVHLSLSSPFFWVQQLSLVPSPWGPEGLPGSYLRAHSFSGTPGQSPPLLSPAVVPRRPVTGSVLPLFPPLFFPHPFCLPSLSHPLSVSWKCLSFFFNLHFVCLSGLSLTLSNFSLLCC